MRIMIRAIGMVCVSTVVCAWADDAVAPDAAAAVTAVTAGTWQPHEYTFTFTGVHSAYSCDWLEEKLRLLLKKAGARADIKIHTHCQDPSGPSPGAEARLSFSTLAPATGAGDTPVEWRKVVLRDHMPLALEASDCELVEQFRVELLPMFTTRLIDNHMSCRGVDNDSAGLDLKFEVLVAAGKSGR